MKWGKRNGPPYPLGVGDHSASEKKAGWMESLKEGHRKRVIKRRAGDVVEYQKAQEYHENSKAKKDRDMERAAYENSVPEYVLRSLRNQHGVYDYTFTTLMDDIWWRKNQDMIERITHDVRKKYGYVHLDSVSSKAIDRGRAEIKKLREENERIFREAEDWAQRNDKRLGIKDTKRMPYSIEDTSKGKTPIEMSDDGSWKSLQTFTPVKNNRFTTDDSIHVWEENSRERQAAKKERMDMARKKDRWDINFLEAVQNTPWVINGDNNRLLKEYSEYLDDPEKYWGKKLPQV